jgi:hypothetical protein
MFDVKLHKNKVKKLPITCSLEIAFDGEIAPIKVDGIQPFFDSQWLTGSFSTLYFTKSSFSYGEKSNLSAAGYSYEQIIKLRFPSNDEKRTQRIVNFEEIKFLKLNLSDGRSALFGRNDIQQNAKISLSIESTLQLTEVTCTSISLYPLGFLID